MISDSNEHEADKADTTPKLITFLNVLDYLHLHTQDKSMCKRLFDKRLEKLSISLQLSELYHLQLASSKFRHIGRYIRCSWQFLQKRFFDDLQIDL